MLDQAWAIRKLKAQPQWLSILLDGTEAERNWGRPRIAGNWALAFMAFTVSGRADVEPWWAASDDEIWRECGFSARPSYATVWTRFAELEDMAKAFSETAGHLIRHARAQSGGLVGQDVHVDGSEAETNARLIHDCDASHRCRRARYPKRMHADETQAERHRLDSEPVLDEDELNYGDAEAVEIVEGRVRIKVGGCWYRTRDDTAGVRAYFRGGSLVKFWHGFFSMKAVDHYTGAPLAVNVVFASVQESAAYPSLIEAVTKAMDAKPRAVVGDRGYSVKSVFELNTRLGISSVFPFRRNHPNERRTDQDKFDRHGVPRCKHCGGPTNYVRFAAQPYPRIWFSCQLSLNPGCEKSQSIACSNHWRQLLPLWRTEEAYFALRQSHQNYERVHRVWRDRYRCGAATHEMRPKRAGLGCQQLRANAALLIEWIRVLDREGWTGSARRNRRQPQRDERGAEALLNLMVSRVNNGLAGPYGPVAVATGQGPRRPRRRRALPPPG
jgi:hypothetical protein